MSGAWLGNILRLLDPDLIVTGGGLSLVGEPVFNGLRAEAPRPTTNQFAADAPIVRRSSLRVSACSVLLPKCSRRCNES
jgi:predicted NBD/HSP70 family sugar kinase